MRIPNKVADFISMDEYERSLLSPNYRGQYNFRARKEFDELLDGLELYANGDSGFLKKEQEHRLIGLFTFFLKRQIGMPVKVVVESPQD